MFAEFPGVWDDDKLSFFLSPLLLSVFSNVSTVGMHCTCPKKNKQGKLWKKKGQMAVWAGIAYLEGHDVTLGRPGPSGDWAGTAKPWFAADFSSDRSGFRGNSK